MMEIQILLGALKYCEGGKNIGMDKHTYYKKGGKIWVVN